MRLSEVEVNAPPFLGPRYGPSGAFAFGGLFRVEGFASRILGGCSESLNVHEALTCDPKNFLAVSRHYLSTCFSSIYLHICVYLCVNIINLPTEGSMPRYVGGCQN